MTILERLSQDLRQSQREKQERRVSVLRLAISALNNKQIEKRTRLSKSEPLEKLDGLSRLTDQEVLDVVSGEARKEGNRLRSLPKATVRTWLIRKKKNWRSCKNICPSSFPSKKSETWLRKRSIKLAPKAWPISAK